MWYSQLHQIQWQDKRSIKVLSQGNIPSTETLITARQLLWAGSHICMPHSILSSLRWTEVYREKNSKLFSNKSTPYQIGGYLWPMITKCRRRSESPCVKSTRQGRINRRSIPSHILHHCPSCWRVCGPKSDSSLTIELTVQITDHSELSVAGHILSSES